MDRSWSLQCDNLRQHHNHRTLVLYQNREVRHLDVPAPSQLKDIDGETWFTGYNEPIEVITAELVSEESQAAKAAYNLTQAKWGTASESKAEYSVSNTHTHTHTQKLKHFNYEWNKERAEEQKNVLLETLA